MVRRFVFFFVCIVAFLVIDGRCFADSRLPSADTLRLNLCSGESVTVLEPFDDSAHLGLRCRGAAMINSVYGNEMSVYLSFNPCSTKDTLLVYDGTNRSAPLLGSYNRSARFGVTLTASSGHLLICYSSAGSDSCFTYVTVNVTDIGVGDVAVSNITGVTADFEWNDPSGNTNMWTIRYGTSPNNLNGITHARSHPYTLQGLTELTTYYYRVYQSDSVDIPNSQCPVKSFRTTCDYDLRECINCTDLTSCRVTATYGSFSFPEASVGVVDNGPGSPYSRHTVHTNPNEVDPRTVYGGQGLRVVPPGEVSCVRLGNWNNGGQGECLKYRYKVDTLVNDLLILKYAAVLEQPGHGKNDQPRFDFKITDEYGNTIDPSCNSALFIPGYTSTPWRNGANGVVWKDWTTVGLDLTPLHGRTIYVTLTTKDCIYSAHYGYAYFVLKCGNRRIESLHCGADVSNTFKAPEGFDYQWYNSNNPTHILSTADTLHVDAIGVYNCRMRFTGSDPTATCEFVSTAVAGPRFPYARFTTRCTDTVNCKFRFAMTNNSVIAEDDAHTRLTTYPCESYEWVLDDTLHFYTTNLTYDFPYGYHTIKLMAKLSGGLCTDIQIDTIYRYPVCRTYDTVWPSICDDSTLHWFDPLFNYYDTLLRTPGLYRVDTGLFTFVNVLEVRPTGLVDTAANVCDSFYWDYGKEEETALLTRKLRTTRDCDSTRILHLTIRKSTDTLFFDTCVENELPRHVGGHVVYDNVRDTLLHTVNAVGCDSLIDYYLHYWPNIFTAYDTTLCQHQLPYTWGPSTFDYACTKTTTLSQAGSHGEDSTVTLTMNVDPDHYDHFVDSVDDLQMPWTFHGRTYSNPVANDTFYYTNIFGCDSVIYFSLVIDYHIVTCDLSLQFPNVVTPNGDGYNDIFEIKNILDNDCFEHTRLIVYNRWGHVVYDCRHIVSEVDFWNPADMPSGTYFFHFIGSAARGTVERHGVVEVINN